MTKNALSKRPPGSAKLVGKVLQFLLSAPETVERLTLTSHGMPEQGLVELHADDLKEADAEQLAESLVDRAEDYAETLDRETRFTLAFHREGTTILTTIFRCGINWQGGGIGTAFDGTTADIIGQMQRHVEAQQRTMHAAMKSVLEAQNYVIEQQRLEMQDMRAAAERVKAREEEQRLEQLEAIIDEAGGDEERLMKVLEVGSRIVAEFRKAGTNEGPAKAPTDETKH